MAKTPTIYLDGQNPCLIVKWKKRKEGEDYREVLVEYVDGSRSWRSDAVIVKFVCPKFKKGGK